MNFLHSRTEGPPDGDEVQNKWQGTEKDGHIACDVTAKFHSILREIFPVAPAKRNDETCRKKKTRKRGRKGVKVLRRWKSEWGDIPFGGTKIFSRLRYTISVLSNESTHHSEQLMWTFPSGKVLYTRVPYFSHVEKVVRPGVNVCECAA